MQIAAERLERVVRLMLKAGGSAEGEIADVAGHLVESNLQGHDSHGVMLLPRYVEHVQQGKLRPNVEPKLVGGGGVIAVMDGGMGYGQTVGRAAMKHVIGIAKEQGVAFLALRNVHHLGRIGAYGEMAAAAGLISIHFVNGLSGPPPVAPFRGSDGRMSTNPVCIAIPASETGGKPMILDFATSAIAIGKVRVAWNAGRQVPPGALVDGHGQPTTDPSVMYEATPRGALQSMGAHKGYGLALMCEVLGGALTGGGTAQPKNPIDRGIRNGMLAILMDPARFVDIGYFSEEVAAVIAHVKASPAANPDEPVLVAGENERITRARRLADGIPIDQKTWSLIRGAAMSLGISETEFDNAAGNLGP